LNIFTSFISSRVVATVSALLVIAIGCAAGIWQMNRAQQKIDLGRALQAQLQMPILNANMETLTLDQALHRRVRARGQYLASDAVWLDNRPRPIAEGGSSGSGQSGFYLMMPLQLEGQKRVVWINRGWLPRNNQDRLALPAANTPEGITTIEGIAFAHPGKVFQLGKANSPDQKPRIEQNFELERESELHQWQQLPFIVREENTSSSDGISRTWPLPTNGVDRHYAYALQWFGLALTGFLFWFIGGLMRYRQAKRKGGD
jgi:surfeit locus 1 family protein